MKTFDVLQSELKTIYYSCENMSVNELKTQFNKALRLLVESYISNPSAAFIATLQNLLEKLGSEIIVKTYSKYSSCPVSTQSQITVDGNTLGIKIDIVVFNGKEKINYAVLQSVDLR